ncbi:MAG: hypothetical protein DRN81_02320 [Thermoproteota archaeon]|nr:MAG: hypothetical protein DRN81_02320 [Candidatus Korarchaeota archaeon]
MNYNICKVKNLDTVDASYGLGTILAPNEEFLIPDSERPSWINDTDVETAISNSKLQVGNNTTYFTDKEQQKRWIKGTTTTRVVDNVEASYEKFFGAEVTAGGSESEQAWTIVPTNGQILTVKEFWVIAPMDRNAYVALIWKYEHATADEEELRFGKGGEKFRPQDLSVTGDGVSELAIVLLNTADTGSVKLAGQLKYELS